MKKRLFSISIIIGLLLSGATFAQEPPADCTTNGSSYFCDEGQSCNNVNGFCTCVANKLAIPYNTTCVANTPIIKNNIASSFAISESIVVFKYKIENNENTSKHFFLKLPVVGINPRIKITNLSSDSLLNGPIIGQYGGFYNPQYLVPAKGSINVVITGQIISSSLEFDKFHVTPCVTNIGSSSCLNRTTNFIWPTANYAIEQKILDPKPIFAKQQAIYEIKIKNNGSKKINNPVTLKSVLGFLLINAELSLDNNIINYSKSNLWSLGEIPSGTTKTYLMKTELEKTPNAGVGIATTSSIEGGNELFFSDNIVTTSYTIPSFLDLQIEKVDKTSEDPEISGNEIGFSLWYKNEGNEYLKNIKLNAFVDGIDLDISNFDLTNLAPGEKGNTFITGTLKKDFPIGTKFCLSGNISSINETESLDNNIFSGICYTFVKSADIAIDAKLENEINSISSGTNLKYKIIISNKGEKTAKNIVIKLFPSNNQKSESPINITGITLIGGEKKEIEYNSILKNYPIEGTNISLTGNISFIGIDLDLTNNNFEINHKLSALSDVYIDLQSEPFNGFKIGDVITYIISYGNSGLESARNPVIKLESPSFIKTEKNERNLGKSIGVGQAGILFITGVLTENLAAGSQFTTKAMIYVDSMQATTINDISILNSTIIEYNTLIFDMTVKNDSWATGNITTKSIRAASGHNITFTINYQNNGNVSANNLKVSLPNIGPLNINPFNTIGSIGIGQEGSIIIKGKIYGTNFNTLTPTATISYNNENISHSVNIEEPYECGDGLITKDEPCDTNLNINYGTGLACENQGGICVLTTKFISNTACIEIDGNTINCDSVDTKLDGAKCIDLTVGKSNSNEVNVTCLQQNAFAWTPYRIVCDNNSDNVLTGLVGFVGNNLGAINKFIKGTCIYPNYETAIAATIKCQVGEEILSNKENPSCKRRVPSCEVEPESKIVILDQGKGYVNVQCSTNNNKDERLKIDCGNNTYSSTENKKIIEHRCEYTDNDLLGGNDRSKKIQCSIGGTVSCENDIILDKGIMGICGDGIRNGYEQCDLGFKNQIIYNYLDTTKTLLAPYNIANKGKKCVNCSIEDESAAQCLSVHNGNISIEKGEYLPFWWRVDESSFTKASSTDCSDSRNDGKLIMSSMMCKFFIQRPNGHEINILERKCISNPTDKIFEYFQQYFTTNTWRYAVKPTDFNSFVNNTFGEYKLKLKEITYEYCDNGEKKSSQTDNVCETNFTITKPYLVQKSAFGIKPKSTNINLEGFKDFNGNDIITRTDLSDIMVLDTNEYKSFDVDFMVKNFIETAEKLAVKTATPAGLSQVASAKKVPNKDIYILYGNGQDIELKKDATITKPFTLIVKNANLIVNGAVNVNGMFIVKNNNGTIKFEDEDCNKQQIVKGIFVADKFDATKRINSSLYKSRCNAGGLNVKGVLIGGGIETLVRNKRSNLSTWFYVSGSDNSIRIQRRNKIFNGASVLIEYSPELWQQLPPGADEFTKMLDVYKK